MTDVYFAVDRCQVTSVLGNLVDQLMGSKGTPNAFALVDLAFDHGGKALAWQRPLTCLYSEEGPLARLAAVSPVLAPLAAHDEDLLSQQIRQLLRHANGRPMLSFLQTDLSAELLSAHWQKFLNAYTEDGQCFLLRWGDTRVLPVLARCLSAHAWRAITHPMLAWLVVNRRGQMEEMPLPDDRHEGHTNVQDVKLGATELESLLKQCEPDAVIQVLHETLPHLLPETDRAPFHHRIMECCQLASQHNVEAFPDVVAIAAADCVSGNSMLTDPRLAAILAAGDWNRGQLANRLTDLMPEPPEFA